MTLAVLASSCRSSTEGGASAPAAVQFEKGLFAVEAEGAARGSEAKVRLRVAKGAGDLNVIIAQVEYDTARMKLKSCDIDPNAGKQLLSLEQTPGQVRTIVTGSPDPLPAEGGVFSCAFTVAADAKPGPTVVRIEGDVSDTAFTDHSFREEATVVVTD
jgi:hypothetical protein